MPHLRARAPPLNRTVSRHKRFQGAHEERSMGIQALFGLSVLMSFVAFGLVTKLYIWPRLRILERNDYPCRIARAHDLEDELWRPGRRLRDLPIRIEHLL